MSNPELVRLDQQRQTLESRYTLYRRRYWAHRRAYASVLDAVRCANWLGLAATPEYNISSADIARARIDAQTALDGLHAVCAQMTQRSGIQFGATLEKSVPLGASEAEIASLTEIPL